MKIVVLGTGVQGTLCGVRLARAGHDVTLIERGGPAIDKAAGSRNDHAV
jgi:glycine/D-amino acid oxidase-like deaminating enzyme